MRLKKAKENYVPVGDLKDEAEIEARRVYEREKKRNQRLRKKKPCNKGSHNSDGDEISEYEKVRQANIEEIKKSFAEKYPGKRTFFTKD